MDAIQQEIGHTLPLHMLCFHCIIAIMYSCVTNSVLQKNNCELHKLSQCELFIDFYAFHENFIPRKLLPIPYIQHMEFEILFIAY